MTDLGLVNCKMDKNEKMTVVFRKFRFDRKLYSFRNLNDFSKKKKVTHIIMQIQ